MQNGVYHNPIIDSLDDMSKDAATEMTHEKIFHWNSVEPKAATIRKLGFTALLIEHIL